MIVCGMCFVQDARKVGADLSINNIMVVMTNWVCFCGKGRGIAGLTDVD